MSSATVEGVDTDVDNYHQKKLDGVCTYPRCQHPASDDSSLCEPHRDDKRERNARHMARKRAAWKERGLCNSCGAPRHKEHMECAACLRRRGILPVEGVDKLVDNAEKRERIKARLIPWENSPQNAGRKNRVRGGERGRRPLETIDDEDIASTKRALDLAVDALVGYREAKALPAGVRLPRVQLDDLERQSMARFVEAGRWIVEVVKRHGYEIPIQITDDDD